MSARATKMATEGSPAPGSQGVSRFAVAAAGDAAPDGLRHGGLLRTMGTIYEQGSSTGNMSKRASRKKERAFARSFRLSMSACD